MKFCTHCGKDVLDDALICPHCGCSVQYDEPQKNAGYSQQATYAPPVADNYSALSILGLVFSFFGGLLGLILSIVAHNDAKKTGSQKSLSMSKAGIIISSVLIGIEALVVIIYIFVIIVVIVGAGAMAL